MKKKNIIVIIISIVIILIAIFASFKVYNFQKFSLDNYRYENLKDFIKCFNIKDTLEFKNTKLKDDYLEFENIKIKNNYHDYTETEDREFNSFKSGGSFAKKIEDKVVAKFDFGIETYTIKGLMSYMKAFSISKTDEDKIKRTDAVDIDSLFNKNHIKDDYDLIKYGYEHKDDKLNILLDSVKKRKQITYLYANLNMFLNGEDDIYLIKGDLKGYMTVSKTGTDNQTTKVIVRLAKDDMNTYYFAWNYDEGIYTLKDIKGFLNDIEIG